MVSLGRNLAVVVLGVISLGVVVPSVLAAKVNIKAPGLDLQVDDSDGGSVKSRSSGKVVRSGDDEVVASSDSDRGDDGDEREYANQSLRGVDWHGRNMSGGNFTNVDFSGANLARINLSNANLVNTNLSGVDLNGANLKGANLVNSNLTGALLTGALWVDGHRCKANSVGRCR